MISFPLCATAPMSPTALRIEDGRIREIEAENEALRARIANLEALIKSQGLRFLPEWRLTHSQRCAMNVLLTRREASRDALFHALYSERSYADQPDIRTIDVIICHMRRKLAPFDVTIRRIRGIGFAIDEPGRSVLKASFSPLVTPGTTGGA